MSGTVAVIGGTGGLGGGIVRKLVAEETDILLGYHADADKAEALAKELASARARIHVRQIDIRDEGSVENFFSDEAANELTGIVNATGPAIPLRPLKDISAEQFWSIMHTDVLGAFHVLSAGMRHLASRGGGSIVQLLTTAVLRTLENDGMSGIPKTAIMGMIRQFAREVGDSGVRLNGIAPGVIDVGIVHSSFEVDETARGVIELCMDRTPIPRMGQPEEVASLAAFLVGAGSAYMNGQIIAVDGGYSA
ncbi:MAG: SDR family NAD(P)-dependent oxidoreductase [Parasphingopyxis sp.]|uniref:SDR family NAD(P)-dependent oxidoreductase n=1 Tax=Parasphingopyxis sp. TaxID=1920299 RepID=UPI003F9FDABF